MGNITITEKDKKRVYEIMNVLYKLFVEKEIRSNHVEIYDFVIFYAPLFLEKKEAIEMMNKFQALFEKEGKTLN
jgi:hypothetical protein